MSQSQVSCLVSRSNPGKWFRLFTGLFSVMVASGGALVAQDSASVVDVRFVPGETRMLEDQEYNQLRQEIHYTPESIKLVKGGSATATLEDAKSRPLAKLTVQWTRTERPVTGSKTLPSGETVKKYGPPVGHFHVVMENLSNCQWSPSANLNDPTGSFDAANSILRGPTVSVYSPNPGQKYQADTTAKLNSDFPYLLLSAKDPEYSLTQCRTKEPLNTVDWSHSSLEWPYTNALGGHVRFKEEQTSSLSNGVLKVDGHSYILGVETSRTEELIFHEEIPLSAVDCKRSGFGYPVKTADAGTSPWITWISFSDNQQAVKMSATGIRDGKEEAVPNFSPVSVSLYFPDEKSAKAAFHAVCKGAPAQ